MNYNKHMYWDRFKLILSDPLNNSISKLSSGGTLNEDLVGGQTINMYNGIKVFRDSYYGEFSDILLINNGVHEPSEEFLFQVVLNRIKDVSPTMLELGSYWAFYSMSFLKKFKNGKSYCIEAGAEEIKKGVDNFCLNNFKGDFTQGFVGDVGIKVDTFLTTKGIDKLAILHSDIQGYEFEMLQGAKSTLQNKLVDYFFISTHSNDLHNQCIGFLSDCEYKVIAEVNLTETFCEDGIILAVSPNIDMDSIELPRRSGNRIINDADLQLLFDRL